MAIPALTRGLTLLEVLMRNREGMRYGELKRVLPQVGDASLNRILISLAESDHLEKRDGLYYPSDRVLGWFALLEGDRRFTGWAENLVEELARKAGESAGFALYDGERIIIQHSVNWPDSVNVIGPGKLLHYEWDHAASLAVLDLLSEKEREAAFSSDHSLTDRSQWEAGKKRFHRGNYYADISNRRPGISRLALPWTYKGGGGRNRRGALFLCLPTVRLEAHKEELASLMASLLARP